MLGARGGRAAVHYAERDVDELRRDLEVGPGGYDARQVARSRERYGSNAVPGGASDTLAHCLRRAFLSPFSLVLLALAAISFVTDVALASNFARGATTPAIILAMLVAGGLVRLSQELRAKRVADRLARLARVEVLVLRDGSWGRLPADELVVGDTVRLTPGERVPADVRLVSASDLFVSQAAVTGESAPHERRAVTLAPDPSRTPANCENVLLKGSVVIGGRAEGVVVAVGADTVFGAAGPRAAGRESGFDRGARSISWVLVRFMAVLVPAVFVACGVTKGDWLAAFLFAVSVAVGLTPEMLPMVVSACLARGSAVMGRRRVVVRTVGAMQAFGSMDVLCVDKTGTLTGDEVLLEYYLDVLGRESERALALCYLNACHSSGVGNPLDAAVARCGEMPGTGARLQTVLRRHEKLDELPFDHERRVSSVLVSGGSRDAGDLRQGPGPGNLLVVKGAVDEVCARCAYVELDGARVPLAPDAPASVHAIVDEMLEDGMRVLAVAFRETDRDSLGPGDERDLVLAGYVAFFDAPKPTAADAVSALADLHVPVRVLTGDDRGVAASVCRRIGIDASRVVTGAELDALADDEVPALVEGVSVFAELSPRQKARVVRTLRACGRTVGFLGDGMNDLPAVLEADVGVSVDTAVEAVREAADVILLKKDLSVLATGVLEGRRAFLNMTKYIKITASSNFGNILSVVAASVLLPFLPMTSVQLLLLNLLYDVLCLVLPWDRVDAGDLARPLEWSGRTLGRFMRCFGPVSSLFDLATFAFLFFVLCPSVCGAPFSELAGASEVARFVATFQTGWFLESMWTQVLILHLLRSERAPSFASRPAPVVALVTILGVVVLTLLTVSPVGRLVGLTALPAGYSWFLAAVVVAYLLLVSLARRRYVRRHGRLL